MGRLQKTIETAERRCAYGQKAGCSGCSYVVYKDCPTFLKFHKRFLLHELAPFDFQWDKTADEWKRGNVVYCDGLSPTKIARVKSNAVNWALTSNNRVMRLNTGQVLNYVLSPRNESNMSEWWNKAKGFYLDIQRREFSEKHEEIMSVIEQFVTIAVEEGCHVFMQTRYDLSGFDWIKV